MRQNLTRWRTVDDASFTLTAPPSTPTHTSTPSPTTAPATQHRRLAHPPASNSHRYANQNPHRQSHQPAAAPTRTRTPTRSQTRAPTASATVTATATPAARVCINEVEYWSNHSEAEAYYEWFELYNSSAATATLTGWTISDNMSTDTLPDMSIAPGGFVIVAARAANFRENYPGYGGAIVELGQPIGNGLANDGDRLILRDNTGQTIDALSYGDNTSVFVPAIPTVAGHRRVALSAGRRDETPTAPATSRPHDQPSPGQGWDEATPTPTTTDRRTTETARPHRRGTTRHAS